MVTIAIANQKGGVGKTTLGFNLAQLLSKKRHKKVLAIDHDPQGNLTGSFIENPEGLGGEIMDAYDGKPLQPIQITKSLYLLGANINLAPVAEREFSVIFKLKEALRILAKQDGPEFDYIFIDCLPSFGHLHLAALNAADYVLISDFPFIGRAEYAHAIALFLAAFVRDMVTGQVPITVIEAATPGTGKTLLAQVLTFPVLGKPLEAMSEGRSNEEMRKRLTAKLMTLPTYVLLDNVRYEVAYSSLASIVTAGIWEDRLLGASRTVRVTTNCIWIITGYNPLFSAEMARRSVRIRLDTGQEKPWLRHAAQFKHPDLIGWVIPVW